MGNIIRFFSSKKEQAVDIESGNSRPSSGNSYTHLSSKYSPAVPHTTPQTLHPTPPHPSSTSNGPSYLRSGTLPTATPTSPPLQRTSFPTYTIHDASSVPTTPTLPREQRQHVTPLAYSQVTTYSYYLPPVSSPATLPPPDLASVRLEQALRKQREEAELRQQEREQQEKFEREIQAHIQRQKEERERIRKEAEIEQLYKAQAEKLRKQRELKEAERKRASTRLRPPLPPAPSPDQIYLYPDQIKFTQDSIAQCFTNGYPVQATINEMKLEPHRLNDFPPIRVMLVNSYYWSLDKRRLYVHRACRPTTPLLCCLEQCTQGNMEEFRKKKTSADGRVPFLRGKNPGI